MPFLICFNVSDATKCKKINALLIEQTLIYIPLTYIHKLESIIFGTGVMLRQRDSIDAISMYDVNISVSQSVKSLGVTLDSLLSFNQHVNNLCKSSYFHIRALRHIRKYLSIEDAKSIATAVVSARLDYCNLVLYGTSQMNINKLQRVQNMLARSYDGSSP